jgi:hypothetical protein
MCVCVCVCIFTFILESMCLVVSWDFSMPKTNDLGPNSLFYFSSGMHKVLNHHKRPIEGNIYPRVLYGNDFGDWCTFVEFV